VKETGISESSFAVRATSNWERDPMALPYEEGYCPVCGYKGWESDAGGDYDDCPCCRVDFCQFMPWCDDPSQRRSEWLQQNGLTAAAFRQLRRNLGIVPHQPPTWPTVIYSTALNHLEGVRQLIRSGVAVDDANERGETALMWAAWLGHSDLVQYLIAHGADVNHTAGLDPCTPTATAGNTPLIWASRSGSVESLRLLCEAGADVAQAAHDGTTALMAAAEELQIEAVEFLLGKQCEADPYRTDGDRPLTLVTRRWSADRTAAGRIISLLLRAGADANVPNRTGTSPLEYAIEMQNEPTIDQLVAYGAILDFHNCRNPKTGKLFRSNPLADAATVEESETSLRILQRLMDAKVDLDASSSFKMTALHCAAVNNRWRAAEMLISAGANLEAGDSLFNSPLLLIMRSAPADWVERCVVPRIGRDKANAAANWKAGAKEAKEFEGDLRSWTESKLLPNEEIPE